MVRHDQRREKRSKAKSTDGRWRQYARVPVEKEKHGGGAAVFAEHGVDGGQAQCYDAGGGGKMHKGAVLNCPKTDER